MKVMKKVHDQVGAVPKEDVTFENVLKPLIDFDDKYTHKAYALMVNLFIARWISIRNIFSLQRE